MKYRYKSLANGLPPYTIPMLRAFVAAADQFWGPTGVTIQRNDRGLVFKWRDYATAFIDESEPDLSERERAVWNRLFSMVATSVSDARPGLGLGNDNEIYHRIDELFDRFRVGPVPIPDIELAAAHAAWLLEISA